MRKITIGSFDMQHLRRRAMTLCFPDRLNSEDCAWRCSWMLVSVSFPESADRGYHQFLSEVASRGGLIHP